MRPRVDAAWRTPRPASRDRQDAPGPPARAREPWLSSPASAPPASKQKPSPAHGTRARGATRSRPAIAGGPSASAVTERPLITAGFRASLVARGLQDALSRDPFAPLPPPGLPPVPGSLSALCGLIAPARATLGQNCSHAVRPPTTLGQ